MGSYGRNFEFRVVPDEDDRRGRIQLVEGADVPVGVPLVIANGAVPSAQYTGALPAQLATGAQAPKRGFTGIGIFEWIDYWEVDPQWVTYSDRAGTIPDTRLCQLISGPGIKVVLRNTTASTFLTTRNYPGRIMVAGMGATPTVAVGNYLTPGVGDDTNGYWAVNSSATNAWLVVTSVDATRQEVEAETTF